MIIPILIWIIGYLFTEGFHRQDKNEREIGPSIHVLIFLLWPLALGDDIRKAL